MTAGITPREAGIWLEPVELVVEWAKQNQILRRFDEKPKDYIEFKESLSITEGK